MKYNTWGIHILVFVPKYLSCLIISCRWTLKVEPIERKNYGIYLQKPISFSLDMIIIITIMRWPRIALDAGYQQWKTNLRTLMLWQYSSCYIILNFKEKVFLIFLKRGHRFSATTDQKTILHQLYRYLIEF